MTAVQPNALMIQGTTSDAGKSALVTGLCRVAARRGVRVAPFKPQNMALNSAVTDDGGEIGRSQAVQAMAAGIAPHSDMNPVLLKPNSDCGAQVIVQGQVLGNRDAWGFHDYKREAMPRVMASFRRLQSQYDLILVEGAGSPAEINLRENDIANMGFAVAANCPVALVADIDRGGVFAHLIGTLACLSEEERALIQGFVINRFRGDLSLLEPGIDWLTGRTGIDTLGVLPYLHGMHLEAEDAVNGWQPDSSSPRFRVVVPQLPRMSNHTDFDALRHHPQVDLRFVTIEQNKPPADLVILAGSKNTISDLGYLRNAGWADYLARHLRYDGRVIGVCGGLQMLGRTIGDPGGIEGAPGRVEGLGLMPFDTVIGQSKRLENVRGVLFDCQTRVSGYEIHMGHTRMDPTLRPALRLDGGKEEGAVSADNRILCSYLHGLFDETGATEALLRWAGLSQVATFDYPAFREQQIERLADAIEAHCDSGFLERLTYRND